MPSPDTHHMLPWYRQFWPWVLILLPASAVIAGISTWIIAAHDPDSLVVDDYYKQGLAINQNLALEQRALDMGLRAELHFNTDGVALRIEPVSALPETELQLALHHPTRAQLDRTLRLQQQDAGYYAAMAADLSGTRWDVTLTPPSLSWRLSATMASAQSHALTLSPAMTPATRR